jgi:GNAT superfamily N-acetyltransferase
VVLTSRNEHLVCEIGISFVYNNKMIKISIATMKDLNNIAELHAQSWRENYRDVLAEDYLNNNIIAERANLWRSRLTDPAVNQLVLVAEIYSDFCGFICAYGYNHATYGTIVDNLHVVPCYKGQGIGTKLLAAAAQWTVINYQDSGLYLEVLACNPKAMKFYQTLGAKNAEVCYWHTPCGNKAKEYIFTWQSAKKLIDR